MPVARYGFRPTSERKHLWPFFLIAVLFVLAIGIFGTAWNLHSKQLDRVTKHSHYARVKDRMSSQFAALEKSAAAEHDKNPEAVSFIPLTLKGGLKARAKALADQLIKFLDECGPRPGFEVNDSMTPTDILNANSEEIGAWVEKIHYTYLAQFKDPLTQIVNELHACGLGDHELDALIDPQIQNADRMRTISEKLRILADRIKE